MGQRPSVVGPPRSRPAGRWRPDRARTRSSARPETDVPDPDDHSMSSACRAIPPRSTPKCLRELGFHLVQDGSKHLLRNGLADAQGHREVQSVHRVVDESRFQTATWWLPDIRCVVPQAGHQLGGRHGRIASSAPVRHVAEPAARLAHLDDEPHRGVPERHGHVCDELAHSPPFAQRVRVPGAGGQLAQHVGETAAPSRDGVVELRLGHR